MNTGELPDWQEKLLCDPDTHYNFSREIIVRGLNGELSSEEIGDYLTRVERIIQQIRQDDRLSPRDKVIAMFRSGLHGTAEDLACQHGLNYQLIKQELL